MTALALRHVGPREFTRVIASALRVITRGAKSPAKLLAEAANTNTRTATNWLSERTAPSIYHWACLEEAFPELQAEIRRARGLEADGESPELLYGQLVNLAVRLRATHENLARENRGATAPTSYQKDATTRGQSGAVDALAGPAGPDMALRLPK